MVKEWGGKEEGNKKGVIRREKEVARMKGWGGGPVPPLGK